MALLHFNKKITASSGEYRGVHPVVAMESHQAKLAALVRESLCYLPASSIKSASLDITNGLNHVQRKKPDFISVTRGPGMRSNLEVGLSTSKGLSVAWQIPLMAVNHMQAHALTPRLISMLQGDGTRNPSFPFLSLLVSGGHTLLVQSTEVADHRVLATTSDIAIGDMLDKVARDILPLEMVEKSSDTMYGRLLERFAFSNAPQYPYSAPTTRKEELLRRKTAWTWSLSVPLAESEAGRASKAMTYSFSGLGSSIKRIVEQAGPKMSIYERIDLAREVMRVAFEHLTSRVIMALQSAESVSLSTIVVSGGVASNSFLRRILRASLDARGFGKIRLLFPPPDFCTDNAAMIAWAGLEMYESGWESQLSCRPLRKWSLDSKAEDGGILGAGDWKRRW